MTSNTYIYTEYEAKQPGIRCSLHFDTSCPDDAKTLFCVHCPAMAVYHQFMVYLTEFSTFPSAARMRNVTRPSPTLSEGQDYCYRP